MNQLKVPVNTAMDYNLEDYFRGYVSNNDWVKKIKSLPYVKDAEWINLGSIDKSHTLITFETEAHKNWFVLRWS
jgi:hypothetical protein